METAQILTASATELARAIRHGEVTSRAVVDAHIARIERINPTVRAMVRDRFADARREADEADRRRGDPRPFHGVPVTIKEAIACEGMPNTSGLWARRDVRAERDAVAVERLKQAGAIVLGVTNVSELCMWMESSNRVWGRTTNAYDPARTAGGSSGGEGAVVGAGGSPLGLGSDVGGSIRMPAFFNGVFGHKPTGGLVPNTGHYPPATGALDRYVTTGPIARRAVDLRPALRVLSGAAETGEAALDLRGRPVFAVADNGIFDVEPAMREALDRAARALEAAGMKVERRRVPSMSRAIEIWSAMLHVGGEVSFRELMAAGEGAFRPLVELARLPIGRSRYTLPGLLLCLLERVPDLMPVRTRQMAALGAELRAELESIVGPDGVLLHPSYPTVAPRHHHALLVPFKWIYTAVFNVLEMPVTQVPLGLDARGLPVGVQVAAANANDDLTIAVAEELERAAGGWVPPPRWPLPS